MTFREFLLFSAGAQHQLTGPCLEPHLGPNCPKPARYSILGGGSMSALSFKSSEEFAIARRFWFSAGALTPALCAGLIFGATGAARQACSGLGTSGGRGGGAGSGPGDVLEPLGTKRGL